MVSLRSDSPARSRAPVLVAGATGFLGRSVVRAISRTGIEVRGLVRDPRKQELVREDGGIPVSGDVLDVPSLRRALAGCGAVIQLAANPPPPTDPARVRVEGTQNIATAARREGVGRLVIGSGYWVYRGQAELIREDSPVDPRGESRLNYDAERAGLEANSPGDLEVLVVRPGMVYGNGSWFRDFAQAIGAGEYQVVGGGANRWSFVERGDAGTAFRAILESGMGAEVYNVVDGHPAPLRDFADLVAAELGAPSPPNLSLREAAHEMGEVITHHLAADRPTSADKLKALGWKPYFSSVQDGVPGLLREMFPRGASNAPLGPTG
ncbi:MAG: NAD(P)H-binding protein [Thermoplasmata archaeon]|nr:NAD(P)H-binding protein [Thermoplasmata archaeon]